MIPRPSAYRDARRTTTTSLVVLATLVGTFLVTAVDAAHYGMDCSWPIQTENWSCDKSLLGDRKAVYDDFMAGCRSFVGKRKAYRCNSTESDRLAMSRRQPQSMVNYTHTGYTKVKTPPEVWDLVYRHWLRNKDNFLELPEEWPAGSIYVNYWRSKTYMLSIQDSKEGKVRGAGMGLQAKIWEALKPTLELWTGMELRPTSMYGIRVYTEGAVLSPHVDRMPLVSSCIINVAQDVDEDWPLEVYGRDGHAVNITMRPGDLVLYESGSVIHGRPFPLQGRAYANLFIHYEPTGRVLGDESNDFLNELDDFYPPYLMPNSPELDNWKHRNPHGWHKPSPNAPGLPLAYGTVPVVHRAAAMGDIGDLQDFVASDPEKNKPLLDLPDLNGWTALHEAVRAGHIPIVQFLLDHGANINARTGPDRDGASPLNIALHYADEDESMGPMVDFLISLGAQDVGPEL